MFFSHLLQGNCTETQAICQVVLVEKPSAADSGPSGLNWGLLHLPRSGTWTLQMKGMCLLLSWIRNTKLTENVVGFISGIGLVSHYRRWSEQPNWLSDVTPHCQKGNGCYGAGAALQSGQKKFLSSQLLCCSKPDRRFCVSEERQCSFSGSFLSPCRASFAGSYV